MFFLFFVPKENPSLDLRCSNYRHQRQESAGILHKAGFFVATIVFRLLSCLCCEFCWKEVVLCSGTCTECDIVHRGKCTGGLLISCPALGLGLGLCLGLSPLGTSSYNFSLPIASASGTEDSVDHRKIYPVEGKRGLGTIWFYFFNFTDGGRPAEGKGLDQDWTRHHSVVEIVLEVKSLDSFSRLVHC